VAAPVRHPHALHEGQGGALRVAAVAADVAGGQHHVLQRGEAGDQQEGLEDVADALAAHARLVFAAETLLRHAMASAFGPDVSELSRTIQAGLRDPRLALGYLELGAKLNGELGRRANQLPQVSVIVGGPGAEAIAAWRAAADRIQHEEAEPH
jgi:hypothetical protein